MEVAGRIRLY